MGNTTAKYMCRTDYCLCPERVVTSDWAKDYNETTLKYFNRTKGVQYTQNGITYYPIEGKTAVTPSTTQIFSSFYDCYLYIKKTKPSNAKIDDISEGF